MRSPPPSKPLPSILVVIVDPETRSARLTHIVQTPEEIQRITGKTRLAKADIAEVRGRKVSVAADNTPAPEGAQRWRLPTTDPLHGVGIVFGFDGTKAMSIPVDSIWVEERIEWL